MAFFGGFLVKSYVEEKTFDRDVQKLLQYYKHVLPGSIMDGDIHQARYVVYKYRHKKHKLWKNLEKKYGEPVRDLWDDDDDDAPTTDDQNQNPNEDDVVELDPDDTDAPATPDL